MNLTKEVAERLPKDLPTQFQRATELGTVRIDLTEQEYRVIRAALTPEDLDSPARGWVRFEGRLYRVDIYVP